MSVLSKIRSCLPRAIGVRTQLQKARIAWLPKSVDEALGTFLDEIAIARRSKRGAKQFLQLKGEKELKLHLGCGPDVKPGWVNIDLQVPPPHNSVPSTTPPTFAIDSDLRRPLPLENDSCAYIYSCHFFEHLNRQHGEALMEDCYRVLRPGGIFRIVLPDFKKTFAAYLAGDRDFFDLVENGGFLPRCENGQRLMSDFVNFSVYQSGEHKQVYDEQTIEHLLKKMGYSRVAISEVDENIDQNIDIRTKYSFYIEAVK